MERDPSKPTWIMWPQYFPQETICQTLRLWGCFQTRKCSVCNANRKGWHLEKELSYTTDTLALQDIPVTCWKSDVSAG